MSYYNRLTPWCIIRCLPGGRTLIVQRFRKRSEAEEHLKILRQLIPNAVYEIIFDLPEEPLETNNWTNQFPPLSAPRQYDRLIDSDGEMPQ